MTKHSKHIILCFVLSWTCSAATAESEEVPKNLLKALPQGLHVMVAQSGDFNNDKLLDYIVVLHKKDENEIYQSTGQGSPRPLLIFSQKPKGTFNLIAQNDTVVYALHEGGQCDAFLDSGEGVVFTGSFFTVENGVACGKHWSDYITFKYSVKLQTWIFHKRIFESWVMNNGTKPSIDGMVLQAREVTSAKRDSPLLFQDFKRD